MTIRFQTDADTDAARVLLGGLPGTEDDRAMYHPTGGRLAGVASCVHTFPALGKRGVYRHHIFTPNPERPVFCLCGHTEIGAETGDGEPLHNPCWLMKRS